MISLDNKGVSVRELMSDVIVSLGTAHILGQGITMAQESSKTTESWDECIHIKMSTLLWHLEEEGTKGLPCQLYF